MPQPFSLPNPFTDPLRQSVLAFARPLIEKTLALETLNRMYADLPRSEDTEHFCERALAALQVTCDVAEQDLARVPRDGPLVVIANHPLGGLEGLALAALLLRVRSDVKLLGNRLLEPLPELGGTLIYVDPFGGPDAVSRNVRPVRSALRWVRDGGVLGLFPAGEVSHASLKSLSVVDPPWSVAAGRLIRAAGAAVLPVCFDGRNSRLFQLLGLLHPRIRTALLPRELLKRRGTRLHARIGSAITPERLEEFGTAEELITYLRVRTYVLKGGLEGSRPRIRAERARPQPIAEAWSANVVAREVVSLPPAQRLLLSGPYDVYHARAEQIPRALREIGRLREIAFRRVGEGTGQSLDLDRFDEDYIHLFVWNRQKSEIVGAYRIGPTDEILPRRGVEGLYTSTLFRFKRPLLDQIGPALEMGRSFVHPDYQKSHAPLTLLWKGIGRFVVAHPRYRRLFGPVSISNRYQSMSRQLLAAFLQMNRYVGDLGRLIRPRHRARFAPIRDWDPALTGAMVKDLEEVDTLIREIELDHKSMPILLRQYLRLDCVLLGFNIDPEFGDVLDGLILVDLARVNRMLLARYMGPEGLRSFLEHWQAQSASPQDGRAR